MNERIQELEAQCWEHQPSWTGVDKRVFNSEKFAELIVGECVEFAYKEADHLEDEFESGRADDLRRWANVMKQHFGVLE